MGQWRVPGGSVPTEPEEMGQEPKQVSLDIPVVPNLTRLAGTVSNTSPEKVRLDP